MGAVAGAIGGTVLGGAGNAISGYLGSEAARKAGNKQSAYITRAMAQLDADLNPDKVNDQAVKFDLARARARLNAQRELDPELYNQRQIAERLLTGQLQELGGETSADAIAKQAVTEAMQSGQGISAGKQALIDAALQELKLGAALPPDVQAELMKAGLETAGTVTGEAAARGAGQNILRQTLGLGALTLKAQRQAQAEKMLSTAADLDTARQNILQSLFPNLQAQQLNRIKGTSGILTQSNAMLPEAGLSGSDITNLWLARTGALNNLALNRANVATQGDLTSGLMRANMIGQAVSAGYGGLQGSSGTGISNFFNSVFPSRSTQTNVPTD